MKKYVNMTDVMNEIFEQKSELEMAKLALRKITMAYDADINCLDDAIILATKVLETLDKPQISGIM